MPMEPFPVPGPRSRAEWLIPLILFVGFALVGGWWFTRPTTKAAPKRLPEPPMVRAEREENPPEKAESFLMTGGYHFIRQERELAAYWFARSALAGHPKGAGIYGAGLIEGLWPPKVNTLLDQYKEGGYWLEKGANANDPHSVYFIGIMTYKGTTGPPDRERGLRYLKDAADLKSKDAIKFLAELENKKPPE